MTQEWPSQPAPPPGYQPYPPYDYPPPGPPRRRRGALLAVGLLGAGVAAGAIIGTTVLSNATSRSNNTSGSTSQLAATSDDNSANGTDDHRGQGGPSGPGGPGGRRDDERAVAASLTAKLRAAALNAVPGATVDRIETDSGDATYEAHMTKANGTRVTVKFDKNGKVTAVESGMGR